MVGTRRLAFVATPDDAGERLDRVLARHLAGEALSRSALARLCDEGRVHLRGAAARPSSRVRAGDAVEVEVPPPSPLTAQPEDIPLTVVHEDPDVVVIDKPAGLVVHPARGHAGGTLVNALLFRGGLDDPDALRPGIVHRLDKDTSGLLVVARNARAREALVAQFKARSVERSYLALTVGVPPAEVTFDTLYGRHPRDPVRFSSRVREGRQAITHVRVLERLAGGAAALVRCRLATGRTHQIRVHLADASHPLLGDRVYGRPPADPRLRSVAAALGRQALHAETLGFRHPSTGQVIRFASPLPADFTAALAALRAEG